MVKAQFALIKAMLMTPLGLLVFVGALVIGFKKLMGATDTTNDTVARLQVAFHAIGRSIKNLVKFLVDGTKALFEFLGPLGKVLKVALAVAFPIVGIGWAAIKAFELMQPPVQKAAGSFLALQNRLGQLNEQIRNLDSEARKLRNTLREFERLSRITFLTPQELARLQELETQLQLDLGVSTTGIDLIDVANRQLGKIESDLKEAVSKQTEEIARFFQENPLADFAMLTAYEGFDDKTKANLRAVAVEYATSLIDGFDDMAPSVQDAFRRMYGENIEQVINEQQGMGSASSDQFMFTGAISQKNFLVKAGETAGEAYARAIEEGVIKANWTSLEKFTTQFERDIRTADLNEVITGTATSILQDIDRAYNDMTEVGFAQGAKAVQDILNAVDPKELEDVLGALSDAYTDIEGIFNLTERQIAGIEASGGRAALRQFSVFQNLASDIFTDATGVFDSVEAERFLDVIFDELIAANPSQRAELGSRLMQEVLAGMTNVPAEAQQRVSNAIQDFLIPSDLDNIITAAFGTSDSIDRLYDLFGQGFNISKDDMDFLSERFPESLVDILNGTADLNAIQEETTKGLLDILDARENDIVQIYLALEAEGQLTEEARSRLNLQLQQVQVARAQLTQSRALTDDIKERFEAERASLKAQRDAIEQSRQLRDLQDRARQASALSTQATRIGAVGTIEARFNQTQLQDQIQQMNRDLEERIQIAKIEAQDRILEETQRKQLLEAQNDNTTALRDLSEIVEEFLEREGPISSVRRPGTPNSDFELDDNIFRNGIVP